MKLILMAFALVIAGCAATPSTDSPAAMMQKMVESGEAAAISKVEYTDLIAGNTIKGTNGSHTYYRDDGVKLVSSKGELVEREWYKDDSGQLCHTLFSSGKLSCISDDEIFQVAKSGGKLFTTYRGGISEWELLTGNAADL